MDLEGISPPLIMESWMDEHPMMLSNDLRKGDCCGRLEPTNESYYCQICDLFIHKKCGESPRAIKHQSHSVHTLKLRMKKDYLCDLCSKSIVNLCYCCEKCKFYVDLFCVKYPPPQVLDVSEMHQHKLTLVKEWIKFDCDAKCGKVGKGFSYKCHECDVSFHMDCVLSEEHQSEVSHVYHPLHHLKLQTDGLPHYSDGKCRLCGGGIDDRLFYHCSACKFSLDIGCVLNPPSQSLLNLKAHDHQLSLLPRLDSFTCNACGLSGDRSPYICVQCDFMIHKECLDLPRIININRHDHRVSRTSVLSVVDSVCGVCRQKVDWNWGGFSCKKCPQYVVHSKCATREDVWNGKELEGIPEETEDIEPYVVIDENTIQHFSHREHYLRLHVNGLLWEENNRCNACILPICLQPFYGCIDCDFTLHKSCAEYPRKKWHVFHNDRLTLVNNVEMFQCRACKTMSNGFMYKCGNMELDVRCASISEPFIHPSHPSDHPLYYIPSEEDRKICNGCNNEKESHVLTCIEIGCGFVLCFKCATFPQTAKHRVYHHPLSLCYGDEETSEKYWCDICEKETNPKSWFYTCKDHRASMHIKCVLGDFSKLMPRTEITNFHISYEVVLSESVSRPRCWECCSRCKYPVILKILGPSDQYICSEYCLWGILLRCY